MTQKINVIVGEDKKTFPIGRRGENNAREVVFDITYFKETFGNGTASLLFARPNEEVAYAIEAITQTENTVNWVITSTETANSGEGKAELSWTQGGVIVKSVVWTTIIEKDIGSSTITPPDTVESWAERLEEVEDAIAGLNPSALNTEVQRATGVEGQLSNLTTTAKTSLVAAINELNGGKVSKAGDTMTNDLTLSNANYLIVKPNMDVTASSIAHQQTATFGVKDANNIFASWFDTYQDTNGTVRIALAVRGAGDGNTGYVNGIYLGVRPDGTRTVSVTEPSVWRDALGTVARSEAVLKTGSHTMTGDLTITKSGDTPHLFLKNMTMDTTVERQMSEAQYATLGFYDKNGYYSGYVETVQYESDGHIGLGMAARTRNSENTGYINHSLYLGIKKDGTKTVSLDQTAWQNALGLKVSTTTLTDQSTSGYGEIQLGLSSSNAVLGCGTVGGTSYYICVPFVWNNAWRVRVFDSAGNVVKTTNVGNVVVYYIAL